MPGGAPLKSSSTRKCKYGPRDSDGRCPKKPRVSSSSSRTSSGSSSSKRPCKYGPRGDDGLCPKKPKAAKKERSPSVKQLRSVDAAARQAGEVIRSKKATGDQKREAVKVLGAAVAAEVGKKTVEHTVDRAKQAAKSKAGRAALKKAAKKAAPVALGVARAVPVAGGAAATLYVGGKALTAQRKREATAFANAELRKLRAKMKVTDAQAKTLWQQYYEFKLKQPVTNSFSGK